MNKKFVKINLPEYGLEVEMGICTFFGHRDCPESVLPALRKAVERAILQEGIDTFYVGREGAFDALVAKALLEMAKKYPHIRFFVVLAYRSRAPLEWELQSRTILADGVENAPSRFAILRRNAWMLEHADTVIAYVTRSFGGAADFLQKAGKHGKKIINIADKATQKTSRIC